MISVVIPAHNEETVISRCLEALLADAKPGELEVAVVCNGCTDRTVDVARSFGAAVQVREISAASKIAALNDGDGMVSSYPRFYLDADIILRTEDLRTVAAALNERRLMAASPRAVVDMEGASLVVRAFYHFWKRTPYYEEGMIGCGVYALTEVGRSRFGIFPDLIADDGYVRVLFSGSERGTVANACVTIQAPRTVESLVKAKTRSRLGAYQLRKRFPELVKRDQVEKRYGTAVLRAVGTPGLWWALPFYLAINVAARIRARRQLASLDDYTWERDDSTREGI